MARRLLLSIALSIAALTAAEEHAATLAGHVMIPAATFIDVPADAPAVDVVDARHIIVGNDNNLPLSSSREPSTADDNEFVLLEVESLLKAK